MTVIVSPLDVSTESWLLLCVDMNMPASASNGHKHATARTWLHELVLCRRSAPNSVANKPTMTMAEMIEITPPDQVFE